jgi:hypothetical protein
MPDSDFLAAYGRFRQEVNRYLEGVIGTQECRRCPHCEEGYLVPANITATAEMVIFCEECDTIWPEGEPINEMSGRALSLYQNTQGKVGLDFSELTVL